MPFIDLSTNKTIDDSSQYGGTFVDLTPMVPSHTPGKAVAPEFQGSPDPARNREVMGISTPAAREDVQNSVGTFVDISQDVAGVVTKAGAGVVKGATLGAVNPEKGTVGIPFTDIQKQVAPPLGESLKSVVGTSPEIADNPYIGMGPEVAGTTAPWGAVSRSLSALTGVVRGAVAAKTVAQAAPVARTVTGELADVGGRVAHQTATGAAVGAAENISPEESRLERIGLTAAMGAGGQIVAEGIRGIAMAAGAAKQAAYQSLVDDLGKWAYGEGHAPTPEAAQSWAAQTVTEIVQDAGGLKNMTIRQARRAAAAVRNATREAAPVDVTPGAGGEVAPHVSEKPVRDVFEPLPEGGAKGEPNIQSAIPQEPTIRQDVPQSRSLPVVQTEPAIPQPETGAIGTGAAYEPQPGELTGGQFVSLDTLQPIPQAEAVNASSDMQTPAPEAKDSVQGKFEPLAESPVNQVPDAGEMVDAPLSTNGSSFADTGGYDLSRKSSIELPEIVEIARELSAGKYPHVLRKLRRRGALGLFRPGHGGKIELQAEIFRTPALAERVLAHEIGHLADWLPDQTMSRGNILGRVASLKKYLKHFLDDSASGLTPIDRQTITTELKDLTQQWKPFNPAADPKYTKYRHSSPELYADAISVLFNDPALLKQVAPVFEQAFTEYIQRKPEVERVYGEIQQRLTDHGSVSAKRVEEVYGMFERGHAKRNELAGRKPAGESIKDTLMRGLVDERHDALKIIRTLEKQGGAKGRKGREARMALEELPYVSSEANEAIYSLQQQVLDPAEVSGISKDDIGALMFARRIVMEGGEKASALGHTAATAQRLLDDLRQQWGVQKFDTAQALVDEFQRLRKDTTIQKAIDEGMFSPELVTAIETNTDYSTNSVQNHLDKDFGGAGNGITAQVYKRVGSLDEIENPFIATVMKDLSIIRAVAMNKAKRTTVAALQEAGAAQPAEMKFDQNFKRMMPVEPDDPQLGTIAYLVNGKPKFFYVAKPIAEGFRNDPIRAVAFARFIANVSQPFRELFVSKNPAWMARNVSRDFFTTVKNLPEVRLRDMPALANHYRKAWQEVWREAHGKGRSDTIREMMEGKGLPGHRVWEARDLSFDDELDRIAASFDLDETAATGSNRAARALRKVWDWLDKTGRASDLWGKVAAYKFMQARGSRPTGEMLRMARNRVGTPNIKRRGAWHVLTNNIFMFSNVNKEGQRAAVESFKENPGAYAWKTFMLNILPRLVLYGAAAGYLGDRTKKILARVPDYEKKQYNIIPLGIDRLDKAVYLALPQDYEGQFFGQLTWSLMNAKIFGKEGALNSISNLNPYREHPMLQLAGSLAQYYLLDINPVDQFRGRQILSDDQATAGGKYAAKGMGKYAWNTVGGSTFYRMTPDMPEADATSLEKTLKTFPMTSLGAYLKVSDRGITESISKAVQPVKRDEARERLIAKDVLKRMVEGEKVQLTDEEAQALAMHKDMVKNTVATMTLRRQNRHLLGAILKAGSKREKAAIIQSQSGGGE